MKAAHQFLMLARTEEHPIRTVSSTRATSSRGPRSADYAVAERGGSVGHRGRWKGKGKGREEKRGDQVLNLPNLIHFGKQVRKSFSRVEKIEPSGGGEEKERYIEQISRI